MSNEKISDALGIEYIPVPAKIEEKANTEVQAVIDNPDEREDYKLVRETMQELIQKGSESLEEIIEIAKQSEKARDFEVVANLLKTVSEISKDLYELQDKAKKTRGVLRPEVENKPQTGTVNVDKAIVFQGTTTEMLQILKREQSKNNDA